MSDQQGDGPRGLDAIKNANEHLELLESPLLGEPLQKDSVAEFTGDEVNQIVKSISEEFNKKYAALDDRLEKLRLTMEKDTIIRDVKTAAVAGSLKPVGARSLNPRSPMDKIAEEYRTRMKIPGNVRLRFVNKHSTLRPLRRSQGYEPVLDEKGAEVQHVDVVLMKIPQEKYREEVSEPRRERRAAIHGALEANFDDDARSHGLEPIGSGIAYDDVAPNTSKEG